MVFLTQLRAFSKIRFLPVSHVIFDIDGLLLRTEEIYYQADKTLCSKYGKEYPWNVRLKVLGVSEQQAGRTIVEECGLPITPEQYIKETDILLNEMLRDVELMPGAEKLVKHLSMNNVPMAVATSSGAAGVEAKTLKHKDLFKLFHHIVMASSDPEVKRGKPAPDVFLTCANRFPDKPKPEKCLVFEDSPNGVKAAVAAGMQVVMVPESYIEDGDKKQATLVLKTLNDFKPELFGLPAIK